MLTSGPADLPLGAHQSITGGTRFLETPKDDTLDLDRANLAVLRRLASSPARWGRMRA